MSRWLQRLPLLLSMLLVVGDAGAADPCAELAPYVTAHRLAELVNPARMPTEAEAASLDAAALELLQQADYGKGAMFVDADNDGVEDLVVWNISGSLRYVYTEFRRATGDLALQAAMDLGVIEDPRFVRVAGVNLIVATDSGSVEDMSISRLERSGDGTLQRRDVCRMRTVLRADTRCRHPACRALAERVEDATGNAAFLAVEWPHKYFGPAGLAIYFPEHGSHGDFDNSGRPTTIWRFGRDRYINEHIYWGLLGQGDTAPAVDPALRPTSEDRVPRQVLPGVAHDRLRQTLAGQRMALAGVLGDTVALPDAAEFFLFEAHGGRTYWAWDFGEPPSGDTVHIAYTRGAKSDYIGAVSIVRTLALEACTADCIVTTDN